MKYQIVLQWPASSIEDYDAMVSVEDLLIEELPNGSDVDGHDGGSGQINIFIQTDNPEKTFEEVKVILEDRAEWPNIRIAYREIGRSKYVIVWPNNLMEFDVS